MSDSLQHLHVDDHRRTGAESRPEFRAVLDCLADVAMGGGNLDLDTGLPRVVSRMTRAAGS
jgi:hypothetical protein